MVELGYMATCYVHIITDGWMDGWMDGWIDG
jgi:hypothetical protein